LLDNSTLALFKKQEYFEDMLSPPNHLTPFGKWLWWRVPAWRHKRAGSFGWGTKGIQTRGGFRLAALSFNCYDDWWPHTRLVPRWRLSVWVLGFRLAVWHRPAAITRNAAI
jgi:hypothetical protein